MKFWRKFIKGIAEFFTGQELKSSVGKNSEQMEELKSKMALLLERVPEEEVSEVALPEKELSLVNPFNHDEEFLKIERLEEERLDILKGDRGYKRIKAGKNGEINALIQQIPNLFSAAALSNSYWLKMPVGKSGELMRLANGLQSTVIRGPNGKIIGHAGLKSMAAAASPLLIFTAMSAVTGQYFMAKINSKLEHIKRGLKDIKGILLDDKMATTESYFNFLNKVTKNYKAISSNKQHAEATLRNLQEVGYKLYGDVQFYHKQLKRAEIKLKEKPIWDIDDVEEEVKNIIDQFTYWAFAIRGYFWQQVLEIYYSKNYDDSYLKSIIEELEQKYGEYIDFRETILIAITGYLERVTIKRDLGEHFLGFCNKFVKIFGSKSEYKTEGEQRLDELKVDNDDSPVTSAIKDGGRKDGIEMYGIIDTLEHMRFRNSQPLKLVIDREAKSVYMWEAMRRKKRKVPVMR